MHLEAILKRYLTPLGRFRKLAPAIVAASAYVFLGGQAWDCWVTRGTVPIGLVLGAAIVLVVLIGLLRSEPPLACAGCKARGWPSDLDPTTPVCPFCGADRFIASGNYQGDAQPYTGAVLGADIVSGAFVLERRRNDDGGVPGGDAGDGDCGCSCGSD